MWLSSLKINFKWKSVSFVSRHMFCEATSALSQHTSVYVVRVIYPGCRIACVVNTRNFQQINYSISGNHDTTNYASQYNFPHIVCSRWMRHPIIFDLWVQTILQQLIHTHNRADAFHSPQLHRGAESAHRGCDPIGNRTGENKHHVKWSGMLFSCSRGKPKDTWLHAEWVVRFSVIHCTHIRRIANTSTSNTHRSTEFVCATVFVYLCVRSVLYNRHSKVDYYHLSNQTSR